MLRVETGSRLHFGLLNPAADAADWPDRDGRPLLPARRFGGVGLMIDAPAVVVRGEPAAEWSAEGPLADRAAHFAREFARSVEAAHPATLLAPARLVVESAPREHVGLGSGTQLALAVARVLAGLWRLERTTTELAALVGRGRRSGLGVHGFARGGLLVDAGKCPGSPLAPLVARLDFPPAWRVVVALPPAPPGLHGPGEQAAFARLRGHAAASDALCRLVLLGMLPAVAEADLPAFGAALTDFNARVGELFAPAQGGTYAGRAVAEVVAFLRRCGVAGVGQSSWGPGVFAVVDQDEAVPLARRVGAFTSGEVWVCRARNEGAKTTPGP